MLSSAGVFQSDGVTHGSKRLGVGRQEKTAMEHDAGIDVWLELSSLCVLDAAGKGVRETTRIRMVKRGAPRNNAMAESCI